MVPPADRRYTRSHVWARSDDRGNVRTGISHVPGIFLGDAVSVDLPPPGTGIAAGEPIGLVESSLTVFELLSPVTGTVVALNPEVESVPRLVTKAPYEEGWLLTIRPSDSGELAVLLAAEEYQRFVEGGEGS
ncbi:MAG: glycine cleavage system protein H [Verrucomicrobiota bacterium]